MQIFILEELADRHRREKLWDIYLGTSTADETNGKTSRAEMLRIRNIERKLANIDESDQKSKSQHLDCSFV